MNLDSYGGSSIAGGYMILAVGIILAAVGELVSSFKIKRSIGAEISQGYTKNVIFRALFWELILGFLYGCLYIYSYYL
jgi:hypothetical protein